MPDLSVIICTHNPRPEYLRRVLDALRKQILPKERWELLVIDNASNEPLARSWDLSWHPKGRHVFESKLGLTPARLCGMREAQTDLYVFVDDDNVLEENYLSEVLQISRDWPILGAWGSGCVQPIFELEPPEHLRRFLPEWTVRDVPAPLWGNVASCFEARPFGAGLCVRRSVAIAYRQWCEQSFIQIMGRQGKALSSGEDDEICLIACKQGLGIGVFPQLRITHLIPKERICEDFLLKKIEGDMTAEFLLDYKFRGFDPGFAISAKTLLSAAKSIIMDGKIDKRIKLARIRALGQAKKVIKAHSRSSPNQSGLNV
jgi:glycosyltransferase involved in cell wall biosynthesis